MPYDLFQQICFQNDNLQAFASTSFGAGVRWVMDTLHTNSLTKMEQSEGKESEAMAAYCQYRIIVYRWIRLLGLCTGSDVLSKDFCANWQTYLTVFAGFTMPILYATTIYHSDGELAMDANACLRLGLKVSHIYTSGIVKIDLTICRSLLSAFSHS